MLFRSYIWGAGERGKEITLFLRHTNFPLRCLDSDDMKWGEFLWDVPIEAPSILKEVRDKILIIFTANKEEELINLCQSGFRYKQDVFMYNVVVDAVKKEYKHYLHKNGIGSGTKKEERFKVIARCFDKWMTENENNNFIREFLQKRNLKRVGVYGYGMLGRHLVFELHKSDVRIEWVMDKQGDAISCGFPVLKPDSIGSVSEVDIIIVTAVADADEVEELICEKVDYPVISLLDVVEEMEFFRKRV